MTAVRAPNSNADALAWTERINLEVRSRRALVDGLIVFRGHGPYATEPLLLGPASQPPVDFRPPQHLGSSNPAADLEARPRTVRHRTSIVTADSVARDRSRGGLRSAPPMPTPPPVVLLHHAVQTDPMQLFASPSSQQQQQQQQQQHRRGNGSEVVHAAGPPPRPTDVAKTSRRKHLRRHLHNGRGEPMPLPLPTLKPSPSLLGGGDGAGSELLALSPKEDATAAGLLSLDSLASSAGGDGPSDKKGAGFRLPRAPRLGHSGGAPTAAHQKTTQRAPKEGREEGGSSSSSILPRRGPSSCPSASSVAAFSSSTARRAAIDELKGRLSRLEATAEQTSAQNAEVNGELRFLKELLVAGRASSQPPA